MGLGRSSAPEVRQLKRQPVLREVTHFCSVGASLSSVKWSPPAPPAVVMKINHDKCPACLVPRAREAVTACYHRRLRAEGHPSTTDHAACASLRPSTRSCTFQRDHQGGCRPAVVTSTALGAKRPTFRPPLRHLGKLPTCCMSVSPPENRAKCLLWGRCDNRVKHGAQAERVLSLLLLSTRPTLPCFLCTAGASSTGIRPREP